MYRLVRRFCLVFLLLSCFFMTACQGIFELRDADGKSYMLETIPEFSEEPYVELNENVPDFPEEDKTTEAFEEYSELDELGRCGQAYANICQEIMPTGGREAITKIHPSGWQSVKYDTVEGKYLYNRCHLIGYQLAGENANEKNLITGTRYFNVEGMLPFENEVAEYVKETDNHVLYRVTPIYDGDDLVAVGVEMEAWSVEDDGEGVCFDVFVYNSQPYIDIDYATGESHFTGGQEGSSAKEGTADDKRVQEYILNTGTHKFHLPSCESVEDMKADNKENYRGSRQELIEQGYSPCSRCKP